MLYTLGLLINTYNAPLLEVGCHDDDLTVIVPHHSPKVFYCVLQWALCGNVLLGVVAVALGCVCVGRVCVLGRVCV